MEFTPDEKVLIAEALAEASVQRIEACLTAPSASDAEAIWRIAKYGLPVKICL